MAAEPAYKLYVDRRERGWWEYPVFELFVAHLRENGYSIEIEPIDCFVLWHAGKSSEVRMRHWLAILQKTARGQFWVLDCCDWVTPFDVDIREIARDYRCRAVVKCQYRPEPYQGEHLNKITPWTYFEQNAPVFQNHVERLRAVRRTRDGLFFRGNPVWENRAEILKSLAQRGVLNQDAGSIRYELYLNELAQHRLALALPGMGNICHREIEAFGAGTPVLMPKLKNVVDRPLVPDVHYISVDTNTLADAPEIVADRIFARFQQVAQRHDYLAEVAANAMRWYDENVRFPASLDRAVRLMNLPAPTCKRADHEPDTIVLIHGCWLTPLCWEYFQQFFGERGYRVVCPAWPGVEGSVEDMRRDSAKLRRLGIAGIARHYEQIVKHLKTNPILIGHSFGGLVVELLLDRGLGAAGISIAGVPPAGVFRLSSPLVQAASIVVANPLNYFGTLELSFSQFRRRFANTMPEPMARAAYDRYVIPGPGRPFFEAAVANLNPRTACRVDPRNAKRPPLLLISGAEDHSIPPSVVQSNFRQYRHSQAITAYENLPGLDHLTVLQGDGETAAEFVLDWTRRNIAPRMHRSAQASVLAEEQAQFKRRDRVTPHE
jgi:pimeloyl-ACP methyl ester carboxylesterase